MAHNNKQFMKVVQWAQKHMKCKVDKTRLGIKIIPDSKESDMRICHPNDKGAYDLIRYLGKIAGVNKRNIEIAIKLDIPPKANEN